MIPTDLYLDPGTVCRDLDRVTVKLRHAELGGLKLPPEIKAMMGSVLVLISSGRYSGPCCALLGAAVLQTISELPQELREEADRLAPLGRAPDGVPENFD